MHSPCPSTALFSVFRNLHLCSLCSSAGHRTRCYGSLLKFGYHFECPAGGVGACVVVGFSLIPFTYELRAFCRRSYTVSVLGQANDLCCFTSSSELRALCKGVHPLIFLSTPSTPPGTSVHHTEHGFAFIPVEVRASIRHIYIYIYVGTCRGTCRRRVV